MVKSALLLVLSVWGTAIAADNARVLPQALYQSKPYYPASALAKHIEGRVIVKFDVEPDGSLGNIRIVQSQPDRVFDQEVIKALSHWQYEKNRPGRDLTTTFTFDENGER